MKPPLVSVIIPTYNRFRFLKDAVESVLDQKPYFNDFEVIVVDDGSTDNTPELLAGYGNRIQVLQQENRGVSAARNAGIRFSHAEFIAFLDSDDMWLPKKLKRQVQFFQNRPEALICQTEEIWIRNGKRINPAKKHRKQSGMIFHPSLELCLISPSAVMMKRSLILETSLFDETLPACEDYDLWLKISSRYPVYLIEEPLVIKRGGHKDQLSSTPCLDKYRIRSLAALIEGRNLTSEQQRAAAKVLITKCRIYADGCRKRNRNKEASLYEKLAGRYLPIAH